MCLATSSVLARAGFDFLKMAVKIFEVVVHALEIGPSRLLAFHGGTVTWHQSFVTAVKERLQGGQPVGNVAEKSHRVNFGVEQVAGDEHFFLFEIDGCVAFAVAVAVLGAIFQMQGHAGQRHFRRVGEQNIGQGQAQSGKARVQLRHGFHHALEVRPAKLFHRLCGTGAGDDGDAALGRSRSSPTCGRNARGCR